MGRTDNITNNNSVHPFRINYYDREYKLLRINYFRINYYDREYKLLRINYFRINYYDREYKSAKFAKQLM